MHGRDRPQSQREACGPPRKRALSTENSVLRLREADEPVVQGSRRSRRTGPHLARAQDTGSQGFIRRYSDATLAAVQQLVSDSPDIETVRAGIPSLSLYDLRDLGGPVGDVAQRRIAADEGARGDL